MKHRHPAGRQERPPPGAQASSCQTDPSYVLGLGGAQGGIKPGCGLRGPTVQVGDADT